MLQHNNIDRQDSVETSPAPFTYTSTLSLGPSTVPAGSFLSLQVYVDEQALMPYRFHSIRPDGKVMICDARGILVGYWQTFSETEPDVDYVSSVLLDMQGVLMGHVACTLQALSLIRNVVRNSLETTFLSPAAFVFLPQCHIAMLRGYGRSFGVQSQADELEYHTSDLELTKTTENVVLNVSDSIDVNLTNSKATLEDLADNNGLCDLVVNGAAVDCRSKSIILRSGLTSNLRVIMENNSIVLRGVENA